MMRRSEELIGGEDTTCDAPLLSSYPSYHEGCPGCWLNRQKATSNGALPLKDLSIVAVLSLSNTLPISSLFSYIYFMVQDLGIATSTTQIGLYVGFIGSSLIIGRFMTSTVWGIVADRYGHKPVIFISTASSFVFIMIFGFSTNYWTALVSRFMIGAGNGMPATIRAYSFEICSKEHQALSLAIVGTMWGFGLIVGPAIGGYLAQPSEKFPAIFPSGSLFDRFPYALPSICISIIPLLGFVLCIWLPESLHNHTKIEGKLHNEIPTTASKGTFDTGFRRSEDAGGEDGLVQEFRGKNNNVNKQLWKNRGFMAAVILTALWILHDMAYTETFPLWAVSPEAYGGLDLTSSEVADVLALSGAVLLIIQLFLFPRLVKAFGTIQILRLSMFLVAVFTATYPLIARFQGIAFWAVLLSVSLVRNAVAGCNMTGSFILVNNAVVTAQRGVANGLSMSVMSAFQAIGPACAGAIFTWAEGRMDASFLPGMWMVFSILSVLSFLAFLGTFEPFMPASLNNPSSEA